MIAPYIIEANIYVSHKKTYTCTYCGSLSELYLPGSFSEYHNICFLGEVTDFILVEYFSWEPYKWRHVYAYIFIRR